MIICLVRNPGASSRMATQSDLWIVALGKRLGTVMTSTLLVAFTGLTNGHVRDLGGPARTSDVHVVLS
jgi:hypothetical protein